MSGPPIPVKVSLLRPYVCVCVPVYADIQIYIREHVRTANSCQRQFVQLKLSSTQLMLSSCILCQRQFVGLRCVCVRVCERVCVCVCVRECVSMCMSICCVEHVYS